MAPAQTSALARARASTALRSLGIDDRPREQMFSECNDVWVLRDVVVRVSRRVADATIVREAERARHLPSGVGYPEVLGSGFTDGHAWVVLRRLPGVALATAWPTMSASQRRCALRDVAALLDSLHATSPARVAMLHRPNPDWYRCADPAVFSDKLDVVQRNGMLDDALRADLEHEHAHLRKPRALQAPKRRAVVHSDVHLFNVMWDGQRATSLIDFEWATIGSPEMDLDELIRHLVTLNGERTGVSLLASVADAYAGILHDTGWIDRLRLWCLGWNAWAAAFDGWERVAPARVRTMRQLLDHTSYLDSFAAATDLDLPGSTRIRVA